MNITEQIQEQEHNAKMKMLSTYIKEAIIRDMSLKETIKQLNQYNKEDIINEWHIIKELYKAEW